MKVFLNLGSVAYISSCIAFALTIIIFLETWMHLARCSKIHPRRFSIVSLLITGLPSPGNRLSLFFFLFSLTTSTISSFYFLHSRTIFGVILYRSAAELFPFSSANLITSDLKLKSYDFLLLPGSILVNKQTD